ncbi:hypothetical protein [Pseudovibrio sp. Tun.PSC04-5.I4]|uniref:hypothetical protein n=1 Tax=Pseudovibrio sp. Tun.PSC04-5.I4 TaxID=1798213 RepID=UPI000889BE42|nr:hypothetical protein [Pseudovibrio sp. Tun.PSC04-5.I4]SDR49166.1 hypothetical protein SAMN04515695_6135 [Pseudovibrio sp. Tun.PSC04-5.I4]
MKQVFTEGRKSRLQHDWSRAAGEQVRIEKKGKEILAYCTQQGCRRLASYYNHSPKVKTDFSKEHKSYCFSLQVSF